MRDHGSRSDFKTWGIHLVAGLGSHWARVRGNFHSTVPSPIPSWMFQVQRSTFVFPLRLDRGEGSRVRCRFPAPCRLFPGLLCGFFRISAKDAPGHAESRHTARSRSHALTLSRLLDPTPSRSADFLVGLSCPQQLPIREQPRGSVPKQALVMLNLDALTLSRSHALTTF